MADRIRAFLQVGAVLFGLSVLLLGCRRGAVPASEEAPSGRPGVPLADLVDAAMERAPGQDSLTVLDRLNPPLRIEAVPRPNRHIPGQIDTLRTFHYAGLQFTVYDVSGSAKEIMQRIVVTDSAYTTEAGVHVGMRPQQVRVALGAPSEVTDGTFVYELSRVTPNQLRVVFGAGRATRLEWDFYVD